MQITPIHNNVKIFKQDSLKEPSFSHGGESFWKSDYSTKDKLIIAGTTAGGVIGSLAVLAKTKGHSIKPKNFFKYLKNTKILFAEVATMGVGTCLGGLAGGYIIDKNPQNRKAKRRESVMQIGNIIIPIGTVKIADILCEKFIKNTASTKGKIIKSTSCLGAVIAGIYLANFAMNKLSNLIFKNNSGERGIKGTDLFPHIDDILSSAQYIDSSSKIIHNIARIVPFALMVAGNEVGNKKADNNF